MRVQQQRQHRRQQRQVGAVDGAPGEAGDDRRCPHHPGPLDRGRAAGNGHIDRDQRQDRQQSDAGPDAEGGEQHAAEDGQQKDVLPTDGKQMREAAAPELLAGPFVDAVVLTEDEAAGEGLLPLAEAGGDPVLGPGPDAIEQPGDPAPATGKEAQAAGSQLERDAEPAQLGRSPILRLGEATGGGDPVAGGQLEPARLGADHQLAVLGSQGKAQLAPADPRLRDDEAGGAHRLAR